MSVVLKSVIVKMLYPQALQAKGGRKYVSMDGNAERARSVEEAAFVSMGGGAVSARSVEGAASGSMGGGAVDARSVEEAVFVSTDGGAISARSVICFFERFVRSTNMNLINDNVISD